LRMLTFKNISPLVVLPFFAQVFNTSLQRQESNFQQTVIPVATGNELIIHIHIGKMAGRFVMEQFKRRTCSWQPSDFWGRESSFLDLLRDHDGEACFTSYEINWWDVEHSLQRKHLFVTILRNPISWFLSATVHYEWTVADLVSRNCMTYNSPCCVPDELATLVFGGKYHSPSNSSQFSWKYVDAQSTACPLIAYEPTFPLRRLSNNTGRFDLEKISSQLNTNIFGIQEFMAESLMLISFQLGDLSEAKALCRVKKLEHIVGKRNADSPIGLDKYGDLESMKAALEPYELVYSRALAVFFRRYDIVHARICGSDS